MTLGAPHSITTVAIKVEKRETRPLVATAGKRAATGTHRRQRHAQPRGRIDGDGKLWRRACRSSG